jgi:teichuronic acid biosynthesis glycosyltransferase TuaG|tara:strand:- start:176 stop:916 length:741 start_codon:yes stop_codon:yes gene_type:complete
MLISIIIPYYKDEINILHSVNSAIKQSYKNIEIIIIDDENSVISKKILLSIKKKSKKIKVISLKKNAGVSQARNFGISHASGNLIAFLDSDDIWKRDKLTMQVDFMNKNKIDLCYTNYYAFAGKKIIYKVKIKKSFDYNELLNECPISCSSVLLKKNILDKNKFKDLKTKEDYELWLRIVKKKYKLGGINKFLTGYRVRDNSLSAQHFNKLINAFKIYNKYNNFGIFTSMLCVLRLYCNAFIKKYL